MLFQASWTLSWHRRTATGTPLASKLLSGGHKERTNGGSFFCLFALFIDLLTDKVQPLSRPGPVERSNQVRVGDLLLKVNGKSVVHMNVKDIEKKIYSSDRGWFGNDDGDVSGEVVGEVGGVVGKGGW
jgi:hypothetical protein